MDEKYFGKPQVFAFHIKKDSGSYFPHSTFLYNLRDRYKPTPLEEMPEERTFSSWFNAWMYRRTIVFPWPEMFFVLETDGLIRLDMLEGLYEGGKHFEEEAREKATYNLVTTIVDWATTAVYDESRIEEYLTCDYGPLRQAMARLTKGSHVAVAG